MNAPLRLRYEGEDWRVSPSFPAYSVSSLGQVKRNTITRGGFGSVRYPSGVLRQRALPHGHRQVTLSMDNKPKTVLVHRLVAEAFLPEPMPGQDCVCHHDDDPSNNRPSNLFWGSKADNSSDMVRKGRSVRGDRVKGAKLTEERVKDIRSRIALGENQDQIAKLHGITQSNVSMIAKRITWRHVP